MPSAMTAAGDWASVDADPLSMLVKDAASFMKKGFERGPAVFKATPARRALFSGLVDYAALLRLAQKLDAENDPLLFEKDINAARYVNGKRETLNGKEHADAASIEKLYMQEGCTMQFHQPQHYSDELWRLLAALERQLGCLVGCNAYITPQGTQGLAPHYDDVEIFVVQTEGSKRWRLYRPTPSSAAATPAGAQLAHCQLANRVSGDLREADIGVPVMEVVLKVGDVLYLPRGTIHQAVAHEESSSHLTISTFQRWTAADLLQYTVSVALANTYLQPRLPLPLKSGLSLRVLDSASLDAGEAAALAEASGGFGNALQALLPLAAAPAGGGGGAKAALAAQLAAACRSLADCLEGDELGPQLLSTAGDAMAEDFMENRLPPHPDQLPPLGPAPALGDSVQCISSSYFRLESYRGKDIAEGGCGSDCEEDHEHSHPNSRPHSHSHGQAHGQGEEDEDEDDNDDEEEEDGAGGNPSAWVRLVSCLRNDREDHMLGQEGSDSDSDSSSEEEWDECTALEESVDRDARAALGEDPDGKDGSSQDDHIFPAEFAPALVQLLGSAADAVGSGGSGKPVRVRDIALPSAELQLNVATLLCEVGMLRVVKPLPEQQQASKQKRKDGKQQQEGGGKAAKQGAKMGAAAAGGAGKKAAGAAKAKKQRT
ncbi:Ribosomal oxygenase 2 [Chlorella vulgaris]